MLLRAERLVLRLLLRSGAPCTQAAPVAPYAHTEQAGGSTRRGGTSGGGSCCYCSTSSNSQAPPPPPSLAHFRNLQQRRHFVGTPGTPAGAGTRSKTEDFDLITPEVGLARIDGLDDTGFVVNDVQVEGSIMLAGDVFTLWKPCAFADVTLDSLALLHLLKPVPDLLVLGCGRAGRQLPADLARQLHQLGIRVDAMDTTNAVATFNVLNQEGRKVVGALLPLGAEE